MLPKACKYLECSFFLLLHRLQAQHCFRGSCEAAAATPAGIPARTVTPSQPDTATAGSAAAAPATAGAAATVSAKTAAPAQFKIAGCIH